MPAAACERAETTPKAKNTSYPAGAEGARNRIDGNALKAQNRPYPSWISGASAGRVNGWAAFEVAGVGGEGLVNLRMACHRSIMDRGRPVNWDQPGVVSFGFGSASAFEPGGGHPGQLAV